MPQMKGLQGWVNGWVNVNNNHVVFPKGSESSQNEASNISNSSSSSRQDGRTVQSQQQQQQQLRDSQSSQHQNPYQYKHQPYGISVGGHANINVHASRQYDKFNSAVGIGSGTNAYIQGGNRQANASVRNMNVNANVNVNVNNNTNANATRASHSATPSSSSNSENSAFYKPGPRSQLASSRMRTQRTSKLLRTNSHSDLLKEKAFSQREGLGGTSSGNKGSTSTSSGGDHDDGAGLLREQAPVRQVKGINMIRRGTVNSTKINGMLPGINIVGPGVSTSSLGSHSHQSRSHLPVNTGQYINENAFANQHHTKQMAAQYNSSATASDRDHSGKSTSKRLSSPRTRKPTSMAQPVIISEQGPGSEIHLNMNMNPNHARGKMMNSPPIIPLPSNGQLLTDQKKDLANNNKTSSSTVTATNLGTTLKPKPRPPQTHGHGQEHTMISTSQPPGTADAQHECNKCELLNKRVISLEADIEYLRCVALNSEYVCTSCEKRNSNNLPTVAVNSSSSVASGRTSVKSNKSRHSSSVASNLMNLSMHSGASGRRKSATAGGGTSRRNGGGGMSVSGTSVVDPSSAIHENLALAESSQRLLDVTLRHKRQIEHMSRETARWQNDMHLKLSKLAMMCKDLNDESAKRKEQVNSAKSELEHVREERNILTSELDILKARVALYEKQEAENVEIRRVLRENDNETLSMADCAIKERDDIINDLTTRLQQALTSLEEERGSSR